MVSKVINHLFMSKATGTIVAPYWPSAPFWPILFGENSQVKPFVADILAFSKDQGIFVQYLNKNTIFGSESFNIKVLAVRFEY